MYWKEVPVQVQAEDGGGQVSKPLEAQFQEGVDAISMLDGSGGTDDYLDAWEWGEHTEMEGNCGGGRQRGSRALQPAIPPRLCIEDTGPSPLGET